MSKKMRSRLHGPQFVTLLVAMLLGLLGMAPASAAPAGSSIGSISPNQARLEAGSQQSFTITLRNSDNTTRSAGVLVLLPEGVQYVAGSASNGGALANGRLSWNSVSVSANGETRLTFKLAAAGSIASERTVTMLTLISGNLGVATIPALLTLAPGSTPPSNFAASTLTVAPPTIAPNQQATYTLVVRNSGGSAASANISATLDSRLAYVDGSASPGANYNAATRVLTWNNVTVPANGSTTLRFDARLFVFIIVPSTATTTATIAAGGQNLSLSAALLLIPVPLPDLPPVDALAGSFKLVSQQAIGPDEQATYHIVLNNSSTSEVEADVTDALPAALRYINGSASPSASYESATGTLKWNNLKVPAGGTLELSFRVRAAQPVATRTSVVNAATITTADRTYERRSLPLVLLPAPSGDDTRPPEVTSVAINGGDVQTDRDVTIAIAATDNVGVAKMQVREWVLDRNSVIPRWRPAQSSGLIDFQTSLSWQLTDTAGTHFIGVWVQDAAGNTSVLDRDDLDFASLLLPNATIALREAVPYLIDLEAGQQASVTLTTSAGDADLYVWFPGRFGVPDRRSVLEGTQTDSVSFTAPEDGTYIILVFGYQASTYGLSITSSAPAARPAAMDDVLDAKAPGLLAEPVLSVAGLDPMATIVGDGGEPATPQERVYLPMLGR